MTHSASRKFTMPKTVLVTLGACVAVALAVAAPIQAATPSTAAQRLVNARIHHKPVKHGHHAGGHAKKRHRTG